MRSRRECILDEIEETGGTLSAIETRWVQQQIQKSYDHQARRGERHSGRG
jgi:methylmalonyl-CoA mutase N-terminal domain/subunit